MQLSVIQLVRAKNLRKIIICYPLMSFGEFLN